MNLISMSSLRRSWTVLAKFTASLRGGITLEITMFDVHCKYCGEPWDNDEFHRKEGFSSLTYFDSYQETVKAFMSYGCGFREHKKCSAEMVDENAASYAQASQILSDYPDDWIM